MHFRRLHDCLHSKIALRRRCRNALRRLHKFIFAACRNALSQRSRQSGFFLIHSFLYYTADSQAAGMHFAGCINAFSQAAKTHFRRLQKCTFAGFSQAAGMHLRRLQECSFAGCRNTLSQAAGVHFRRRCRNALRRVQECTFAGCRNAPSQAANDFFTTGVIS